MLIHKSNQSAALTPPEYITPAGMQRGEFRAMGTTISVLLPIHQATEGIQIVRSLFTAWEEALSRFLPESELSQLNQQTGLSIAVSDLLYHVLTTALKAARSTQGVYDPTLLNQIEQIGYDRTFDALSPNMAESNFPIEPGGGWHNIKVDHDQQRVTLPLGTRLDFGGIAKGMAVDAALAALRQHGISSALINAGGDLALLGRLPDAELWPIAIPGRRHFWTIPLSPCAVATSGIDRRRWLQGSTLRHHLLDPRTGIPVQNTLWSVTAVADRCEQAEIAAKAAFILGPRQGADLLRQHRIAGLFVHKDGNWETVGPWPIQLMNQENPS